MKKRISFIISLLLLVTFVFQALAFTIIPIKGIKLSTGSASIKVGQTITLKAVLNPVNTTQKTLVFNSANPKVALVDKKGIIKGVGAGKTSITVTSSVNKKIYARFSITVLAIDNKPIKILLMVPELKNDTKVKEGFKLANPKIDYNCIDADYTKLMSMIAAGNAPDVISTGAFHTGIMYASRGLLLNLDPYIAKSKILMKNDFTDIQKYFMWDGKKMGQGATYGIVKDWSLDTQLWLNKKVFADAGIPLPDKSKPITFSQLAEYAKKMVKYEDGKQVRWGFAGGLTMEQMIMFQLAQLGKSLYSSDFKSNFNSLEVKQILQYWTELSKAGGCSSPLGTPPDYNGVTSFFEDKVGIAMWGYWYTAFTKMNEKAKVRLDDFVFVQSPVMDNAVVQGNSCIAGVGGSIYSKSKNPEEAWKFIEYYYGGSQADERAKAGWGIPMLKSRIPMMPTETAFEKQAKAMNDIALTKVISLKTNPFTNPGATQAIFDKYYNQLLFDKIGIDECIKKIDQDMDLIIEEGKEIAGVK